MSARRTLCLLAGLAVLDGCGLKPSPQPPVASYDLGPPGPAVQAAARIERALVVDDPVAPLWLDTRDMRYRLAYEDPARLRRYANSRWAASPVHMLGDLLRRRLAAATRSGAATRDHGVEADYQVHVEIDDFSQVFDAPGASRGVVLLRAVLVDRQKRRLVAQKAFAAEMPAPTPDGRGGVTALAAASEAVVAEVIAWIAGSVAPAP